MGARFPVTLNSVRKAMLVERGVLASLALTAVAVIVPTAIRYALGTSADAVPFVTYYPAIMLAGLFLGWRYGLMTAILSTAAASLLFLEHAAQHATTLEMLGVFALFALSCAVLLGTAEALRQTLVQLTAASAREELLNAELRHRFKNLLAVVSSLVTLTRRYSDPQRAEDALNERIQALSRAVDLLGTDGPRACALPDLAQEALQPFIPVYDIRLSGPPCAIDRASCVPAVLAVHELTTNAIKYGSLSAVGGWVEITWEEAGDGEVNVLWREHGGPPVAKPTRRGMGSKILSMESDAARFELQFPPDGARCSIVFRRAADR